MSIVRELPVVVEAMASASLITCSTGNQVFAGSTANSYPSSNGSTGVLGRIIDRMGELNAMLTQRYLVAAPYVTLWSSRGSTEADRKLTLGLQLMHGDSSGGGDAAALSTQQDPATVTFFTTQRTTPEAEYTTGLLNGVSSAPCYYDLRAAKRYLSVLVKVTKNRVTTESSGDEGARVAAGVVFMGAEQYPAVAWTSQGSTSTST